MARDATVVKVLDMALRGTDGKNQTNNGRLFLAQRTASKELRSHHNQIARWYRELQHFGFIVMIMPGFLGVEGMGQAPRWRLTELGYMREPPTKKTSSVGPDHPSLITKSRAAKPAPRVSESTHSSVQ